MSAGCFHQKGLSFSRPGSALHTTLGAASPFPTPHSSTLGLVAESHFKQSMQQQLQEGNRHAAKQLKQLPPAMAQHGQASIRRGGGGVQGGNNPASFEGRSRRMAPANIPACHLPQQQLPTYDLLLSQAVRLPMITSSNCLQSWHSMYKPTLKGGCRGAQPPSLQAWSSMYKPTSRHVTLRCSKSADDRGGGAKKSVRPHPKNLKLPSRPPRPPPPPPRETVSEAPLLCLWGCSRSQHMLPHYK